MKKFISPKKRMLLMAMLLGVMSLGLASMNAEAARPLKSLQAASAMKLASINTLKNDTRTFNVDKNIEAKSVTFENRYGFEVAGHLYLPKDFDVNKKYQAVVITGPFGAVKEQSSGLYAQELAKNGFGMAITAAGSDSRIKAVATASMYDMSESISDHYNGAYYTPAQRELVKKHLAKMRNEEAREGKAIRGAHELEVDAQGNVLTFDTMFPNVLPAEANAVIKDFFGYYVGRAYHPRAINSNTLAWDATTPYGFFDFKLMSNIDELGKTPVLLITGSEAHSKYFSDNVYAKISGPKEEVIVPGATHVDLYDQMDKIPFTKLVSFFKTNL